MDPPPPINSLPYDFVMILVAMLVSGIVLLVTASYVRQLNKGPTTRPFVTLLVLCAAWSFLNALVIVLQDQGQKILFQQIEYLSIIFIPVALLITIMTYLGRTSALKSRYLYSLLIVPLVSVAMLLTNDFHHLFFTTQASVSYNGMMALVSATGPYYLVHILYVYSLVVITIGLLIGHMLSVDGAYRRRDMFILVGISLAFFGDAVSILGYAPSPGASWAPVLFMVMGFILIFALFKYHTFDLMPLARSLVWKNTPDPLFVVDEKGLLVDVNRAGSNILERTPDLLMGRSAEDLMSSILMLEEPIMSIGSGVKEITVGHGGSRKMYEVIRNPILDQTEQPLGTLVLFRDITIQKAIQEVTLKGELKYRMLIEKTPFPIAVIGSSDGSVRLINGSMEQLMKGNRREIIAQDIGSFFLEKSDMDSMLSVLGQNRMVENYEAALVNSRGERFWAYISAIPVTLDGELEIIFVINDISDRKMAEALGMANKKLNLLQGISRHDLMNKFMAISGYIDLAKMTDDPEKRKEIMAKLEHSANAAQELIRFTHDYENLGVNAPIWQPVIEVINKAQGSLDLNGIQLTVEIGNLNIFADSMLYKVFYNLMENSLRHGEHVTRIRIHIKELAGQGVSIIYEDDGVGITHEDKKSLFRQGFGKNTGQGMFLTREILLITGMTIFEDGEPGKGVKFNIKVPPNMYSTGTIIEQSSRLTAI